ncbi:MAG: hypothetical protein M1381_01810 [Deltaproteobacteria bacterium]|nr:hypothetical protein [Deltaproteobacteria bacterium]MCL5793064.1 hypothetical protein [Deltaproteobacteria bacterium]
MLNKPNIGLFVLLSICVSLSNAGYASQNNNAHVKNTCVICHSKISGETFVGIKSHSWENSIHQEHGITCNQCHGGNPKAITTAKAHIGVLGSSNPDSGVYYKNIPKTCGRCHNKELYKYTESNHFKKLEATGQGPNCVTCHGSMVTTILTPDDMANVCDKCHNTRIGVFPYIPEKAKAVLMLLDTEGSLIAADEKIYSSSKEDMQILQKAKSQFSNAKLEWHAFDLDKITKYLQNTEEILKELSKPPVQTSPVSKQHNK